MRLKAITKVKSKSFRRMCIRNIQEEYSEMNNYSAVVKIIYGESSFLFTGDAEKIVESEILNSEIDVDVLKVGHHGSETSSSDAFIQKVSPDIAVISCGENNSYGHPDEITIDTLNKYDTEIYRTDESGTVIVTADQNKKIWVDKKASPIKEKAPPIITSEEKEKNLRIYQMIIILFTERQQGKSSIMQDAHI